MSPTKEVGGKYSKQLHMLRLTVTNDNPFFMKLDVHKQQNDQVLFQLMEEFDRYNRIE